MKCWNKPMEKPTQPKSRQVSTVANTKTLLTMMVPRTLETVENTLHLREQKSFRETIPWFILSHYSYSIVEQQQNRYINKNQWKIVSLEHGFLPGIVKSTIRNHLKLLFIAWALTCQIVYGSMIVFTVYVQNDEKSSINRVFAWCLLYACQQWKHWTQYISWYSD